MSKKIWTKEEYQEYLASPSWRKKRVWVLDFWDHSCSLCNTDTHLHVHHRTYARLGEEKLSDMIVLCETCHEKFHNKLSTFECQVDDMFDEIRRHHARRFALSMGVING